MSPEGVLLGEEGKVIPCKGTGDSASLFPSISPFFVFPFCGTGPALLCPLKWGLLLFRPVKWSTAVLPYGLMLLCPVKWAHALLSCQMVQCCSVLSYGLMLFCPIIWANVVL